jgi:hypothetical protein
MPFKKITLPLIGLLFLSSCALRTVETKFVRLKNCKRVSIYWDYCDIDRGGDKGTLVNHY